ncbi:ATP-binding protein [Perlabentimonas gracilis]|uniref:ATP-binding protein n=1 Tax=Perlabentimonas gracilis TaxID=2715279 RepID=UPI0014088000|nr:ATP-binding protein [Perlabentimonas gracilis]NHB68938.1 ATP-binding protein [Perlabentimonas gracilis]
MFIKRDIAALIEEYLEYFPVVCVTGPRQSGKTTLVRKMFPDYHYFSFEDPDHKLLFNNDPKGFLESVKQGAILDEAQKAPEIFSYLQGIIDEPNYNGKFIISGSQNFLLLKNVTQTLAGRAGIVNVLPFSVAEIGKEFSLDANTRILQGLYPRVLSKNIPPELFYPNYIQTFIERDIIDVRSITDKTAFYRFIKLCAARCGQILNYSQLALDCGIAVNTAKAWLSLLESSFIVFLLPPYFVNISKQLVKSPKLYFYDVGLVSALLQIKTTDQLKHHAMYGALFENLLVAEMMKLAALSKGAMMNYFLRDKTGHEIDLLVKGSKTSFVEIKSGHTIKDEHMKNLLYYAGIITHDDKYILHQGQSNLKVKGINILNWIGLLDIDW